MEKQKSLSECTQQINTGNDGQVDIWCRISGFDTVATKIYMENMDGKLYCDILQHPLKSFMAQMSKKSNFFPTRPSSLAHITYREMKNRPFKTGRTRVDPKKARFTSNRDAMVYSRYQASIKNDLFKSYLDKSSSRRMKQY